MNIELTKKFKLSIVIPVYNEEEVIGMTFERLQKTLNQLENFEYEVIFINDGSNDKTFEMLCNFHQQNNRFKTISFSRNFGHQIAISAGLNFVSGDAIVIMDADLQDPPEIITEFIKKWRDGYHVVYGIRTKRKENWFKKSCYKIFYHLIKTSSKTDIPLDAGDFCLMDKKVVDLINQMPERTKFLRGLRSWVGFNQTGLIYERDKRYAGKPKYTFLKLSRLALDGFISFSDLPLKIAMTTGFIISFASVIYAIYLIIDRIFSNNVVPGWATIAVAVTFFGGIQLLMFGVLFSYVNKIFNEVKGRPLYILDKKIGFEVKEKIDEKNNLKELKEFKDDSH